MRLAVDKITKMDPGVYDEQIWQYQVKMGSRMYTGFHFQRLQLLRADVFSE